jgi:hypothetical protein
MRRGNVYESPLQSVVFAAVIGKQELSFHPIWSVLKNFYSECLLNEWMIEQIDTNCLSIDLMNCGPKVESY